MKDVVAGRLGPVFHADGSITLLDIDTAGIQCGDRIRYVSPKFGFPGQHDCLGTGIVISIEGSSATISEVILPKG